VSKVTKSPGSHNNYMTSASSSRKSKKLFASHVSSAHKSVSKSNKKRREYATL
jgi:hypothetical protein